jgi:hypothetical protein
MDRFVYASLNVLAVLTALAILVVVGGGALLVATWLAAVLR